jgi:hypothetical protein
MDPPSALIPWALQVQHEWGSRSSEVTDVQTFGSADSHPPAEWLMHMPEQREPRLSFANQSQQRLTADLKSTRDDIEGEFRYRRGYVRAQHVDPSETVDPVIKVRHGNFVWGSVRGWQTATDKTKPQPADLDHLAIENTLPLPNVLRREPWDVNVAERQQG